MKPQEVKKQLEEAGFKNVSVEPSAVARSPYEYIYVYLTDEEAEGWHIIISEGEEWGEDGIIVGLYKHYEEEAEEQETVTTISAAIPSALRLSRLQKEKGQ